MITCRELIDFIIDYLEGTLPPEQRDRFQAHLAGCRSCVAYLESYRRTIELGREACSDEEALAPEEVPEDLVRAILAARRGGAASD